MASQHSKNDFIKENTRKVVLTAMFLAFALALKAFTSVSLPLFGANGVRVSFGGIFTAFPAILFGPVYGGLTSALSDVLGWVIKPNGDYNVLFTIVAFVGGFVKGLIWLLLKKHWSKKSARTVKAVFAGIMLALALLGVLNCALLRSDGITHSLIASAETVPDKESVNALLEEGQPSALTRLMAKLVENKKKTYQSNLALYYNLAGPGLSLAAFSGLFLLGVAELIRFLRGRKKTESAGNGTADDYLKIFVCILLSGLLVTTVNTEIIIRLYGITVPFLWYWIPRLLEEILVCAVQAYFIAVLYGVFRGMTEKKHGFGG